MDNFPRAGGPVFFYAGGSRYPAMVTKVHSEKMVDVAYEYGGGVLDEASVPIVDRAEPGPADSPYAREPLPDDNVDVEAITLARANARRIDGGMDAPPEKQADE